MTGTGKATETPTLLQAAKRIEKYLRHVMHSDLREAVSDLQAAIQKAEGQKAKEECSRCGAKIRDAEYLVDDDGLATHFSCPVVAR